MASVTLAPASVTLGTVNAFADVTLSVSGVPSGVNANATFPITVDGVVANGSLTIQWPTSVPSHGSPTLDAALTGRVTLVRSSLAADGLSAVYRVTRTS
jgi:hypothetical protein